MSAARQSTKDANGRNRRTRSVFRAFRVVTGAHLDHCGYDRFSPVFWASHDRYDQMVIDRFQRATIAAPTR